MKPSVYYRSAAQVPRALPNLWETVGVLLLSLLTVCLLMGLLLATNDRIGKCEPSQYRHFAPFEPTRKLLKQYANAPAKALN